MKPFRYVTLENTFYEQNISFFMIYASGYNNEASKQHLTLEEMQESEMISDGVMFYDNGEIFCCRL